MNTAQRARISSEPWAWACGNAWDQAPGVPMQAGAIAESSFQTLCVHDVKGHLHIEILHSNVNFREATVSWI